MNRRRRSNVWKKVHRLRFKVLQVICGCKQLTVWTNDPVRLRTSLINLHTIGFVSRVSTTDSVLDVFYELGSVLLVLGCALLLQPIKLVGLCLTLGFTLLRCKRTLLQLALLDFLKLVEAVFFLRGQCAEQTFLACGFHSAGTGWTTA